MIRWLRAALFGTYFGFLSLALIGSLQQIFSLLSAGKLFASVENDNLTFSDFIYFYLAGHIAHSPDAHAIYDPAVQLKWLNQLLAPISLSKPFYNQHVPFEFVLWIPAAMLPLSQSYVVWLILCVLAGLSSLALLLISAKRFSKFQIALVLFAVCASFPSMMSLRMGQQAYVFLTLECLFFWAFLARRDIAAGVTLALVSMKPHYCLFFAIPALADKRWKLLLAAAGTELALLALAGLVLGWENVLGYPSLLLHAEQAPNLLGVDAHKMVSFRGIATLFLPRSLALYAGLAVMALGLLITFVVWKRAVKSNLIDLRVPMSLTILLCLVTSAHTHSYDLLLLAVLALTLPGERNETWQTGTSYKIWCWIIYLYPVTSYLILSLLKIWLPLPFIATFLLNVVLIFAGLTCFRRALAK
jgi:alpha-1,2-mannosyltransferase